MTAAKEQAQSNAAQANANAEQSKMEAANAQARADALEPRAGRGQCGNVLTGGEEGGTLGWASDDLYSARLRTSRNG